MNSDDIYELLQYSGVPGTVFIQVRCSTGKIRFLLVASTNSLYQAEVGGRTFTGVIIASLVPALSQATDHGQRPVPHKREKTTPSACYVVLPGVQVQ